MRSTFSGFNTARSGLFAAQRALDVVGHNIANVNTPGYTRQRVEQTASTPMAIAGGKGMLGTGVNTLAVKQLRNEFLDYKYRSEINSQGYWEVKRDGLSLIESIMNEPSDTGIATVMDELFSSFQELSKNPENQTTRSLVRQRAIAFTNSVNSTYNQLEKMATDLNFDIQTTVKTINTYAEQIAVLNEQIYRFELNGSNANDLRDQRNYLIDQLSKLVNVDVIEVSDGNYNVASDQEHVGKKMVLQINGQSLVSHDRVYKLSAEEKQKSEFFDEMGADVHLNVVQWADGSKLNTKALQGELRALLDLRDGDSGANKGVPYYINELNRFVEVFAQEINDLHVEGYGLGGETGYLFFTANGVSTLDMQNPDAPKITAKNIKISLDIEDPNKIAASSSEDLLPGDGSIALKMLELRHKSSMFQEGKPEDFIKSLISNLGVDTQEAIRNAYNQYTLTEQVDIERQRISGVSTDEELSKMVMFQHAYNASARMMTTMDEMLETIISRVGLVGR
ncbi:flagellar hook-associated protein FlgK [Clostridium formicaceticum]|uniref:Flagellar hook-associated protein 1 n=1 Tax=Clostridium formicaceticum TaxID=1497 RepID=A0AAC9RKI8_9CLOT|nr:flagellar hook-associated protein FlgK [Clostridium formicaceticum]AOY75642.1 flagellar hook-associated protein FlgK [Clostridium formicaceticum]ARE85955.1 Flagellar hook-associated protein 1 [Clostridium formicaceticum]